MNFVQNLDWVWVHLSMDNHQLFKPAYESNESD